MPLRVDREEAVHLPIEPHILDYLSPIGLQRASEVMELHSGERGDELVGQHAGQVALERIILTVAPPSGADIIALLQFGQHLGDILRVVLIIPIHRDDYLTRGMVKASHHRRRLAEISPEVNHFGFRMLRRQSVQHGSAAIRTAVIHENHLVGLSHTIHHLLDFGKQRLDRAVLVIDRYSDGNHVGL